MVNFSQNGPTKPLNPWEQGGSLNALGGHPAFGNTGFNPGPGGSGLPFSPNGPAPMQPDGGLSFGTSPTPGMPDGLGVQPQGWQDQQGTQAPQPGGWMDGLYGANDQKTAFGTGPAPPGTAYRDGVDGLYGSFLPGDSGTTPGSESPWPSGGGIGSGGFGSGGYVPAGGQTVKQPSTAPQAGQFANNNQGFLDWATQKYGSDKRGGGFVNTQAGGGLQNILKEYAAATGNTANYMGGPSGDRVDFGQGAQDALTSGGLIWNAQGGGGAPSGGSAIGMPGGGAGSYGGGVSGLYGGSGGGINLPTPPPLNQLQAPGPFQYQQSNLGQFQGPSPYQAPAPFQYGGGVPSAPNLQQQQISDPQQLQYQTYNGMTADQLKSDPSYQFRFDQGANAASNILAHSGALRTGNAAKALTDYGQQAASQEYAAADARARQNVQGNNANAYQFGNANIANQFQAQQANNQNAFNFGNQNFQNALAAQGQGYGQASNTYGMNAATQQGAQNQNFNQALASYGANLGAQNQNFNQALGAYQTNANTGLQYGSQNQNNALANYQAQVNAQLGLGNLNLGFQNSNNSYALGQGNLALGQGQLGLQQNGQQFNQGLQSWQQNYQANVLDPWNMQMQLAQLGNPGAPNGQANANAQGELLTGAGNAGAASQLANPWGGWWNNVGNLAAQIPQLGGGPRNNGLPGYSATPQM